MILTPQSITPLLITQPRTGQRQLQSSLLPLHKFLLTQQHSRRAGLLSLQMLRAVLVLSRKQHST